MDIGSFKFNPILKARKVNVILLDFHSFVLAFYLWNEDALGQYIYIISLDNFHPWPPFFEPNMPRYIELHNIHMKQSALIVVVFELQIRLA